MPTHKKLWHHVRKQLVKKWLTGTVAFAARSTSERFDNLLAALVLFNLMVTTVEIIEKYQNMDFASFFRLNLVLISFEIITFYRQNIIDFI